MIDIKMFSKHKWIVQFIKFGIVGVSNTLLGYLIYTGALLLLRKCGLLTNSDYVVAQAVSFVISVLWSFYWNNRMVFIKEDGTERNWLKALLKTYISYSFTGLFLNSILLLLWVRALGISEFIAPFLNLIFSVPANFLLNKFWAFKAKEKED